MGTDGHCTASAAPTATRGTAGVVDAENPPPSSSLKAKGAISPLYAKGGLVFRVLRGVWPQDFGILSSENAPTEIPPRGGRNGRGYYI